MHRETSEWTIRMLVDFKHRINVDAEYQRAPVWSKAQRALLIDSILRDFDIPKIILRKQPEGSPFLFDVIDGKQRLTAIWGFFSNKFAIPKSADVFHHIGNLGGRYWKDLPEQAKDKLQFSNITISRITDVDSDAIRELFLRLQRGEPLNAAEKRNAMKGPVRDFVASRLAKHPLWETTRIRRARFGHEEHAAIALLIILKNGPTSLKSADLIELYEDHSFDSASREAQAAIKILDRLHAVTLHDHGFIRTRWGLVDMAISLMRLSQDGRHPSDQHVMDFFRVFERMRRRVSAFLSDLQANLVDELRRQDLEDLRPEDLDDLRDVSVIESSAGRGMTEDMLVYHMAFAREGASEQSVRTRSEIMYRQLVSYLNRLGD